MLKRHDTFSLSVISKDDKNGVSQPDVNWRRKIKQREEVAMVNKGGQYGGQSFQFSNLIQRQRNAGVHTAVLFGQEDTGLL